MLLISFSIDKLQPIYNFLLCHFKSCICLSESSMMDPDRHPTHFTRDICFLFFEFSMAIRFNDLF